MEGAKTAKYESSELEADAGRPEKAETSEGAVKHNRGMGLILQAGPQRAASNQIGNGEGKIDTEMTEEVHDNSNGGSAPLTGHELDSFLGKAFEEKPVWAGLWESIHDVFFPVKLPPLELTSKPIPVPDLMAVKANPWAIGISSTINIGILLVVLFFVGKKIVETVKPNLLATNIDLSEYKGPKADKSAGGGGGGGNHSIIDANKGKLPEKIKDPVTPPQPQTLDHPKLPQPPAINVQANLQLPDNPNMPMIGVHSSANVQLASAGSGSGAGMGTGGGGGLGSGNGNGYGPGSGGNAGGGVYQIGGGISSPIPIFQPEAEFSDEARRAKYQGVVLISLIVDAQGNPQNVHVIRSLGMGLDEKAMEAVRKYKFKPAMKDGKTPVPVMATIEVNFRLY